MRGLTLDAGALIALDRKEQRMARVWRAAHERDVPMTVSAVVVAEWWRGQRGWRAILAGVEVEPVDEALAKAAGEALAKVPKAHTVDALVMASAARRGDVVYTKDFEDLDRLQQHFQGVKVLRA